MNKVWMSSNRSFGLVFFAFFLIIGLWPIFEYEDIRIWSIIAAFIFLILTILDSKYLTPLNRFWMKFGLFLGKIISPIVMGVVFFCESFFDEKSCFWYEKHLFSMKQHVFKCFF